MYYKGMNELITEFILAVQSNLRYRTPEIYMSAPLSCSFAWHDGSVVVASEEEEQRALRAFPALFLSRVSRDATTTRRFLAAK